jgi:hypothetical protein
LDLKLFWFLVPISYKKREFRNLILLRNSIISNFCISLFQFLNPQICRIFLPTTNFWNRVDGIHGRLTNRGWLARSTPRNPVTEKKIPGSEFRQGFYDFVHSNAVICKLVGTVIVCDWEKLTQTNFEKERNQIFKKITSLLVAEINVKFCSIFYAKSK